MMRRKKRGLGWYFGMAFGDPAALADTDAPGLAPGGPRRMYVVMWILLGLVLAAIPGLVLWRAIWVPVPALPVAGATKVFDGVYSGIEGHLTDDQSIFKTCSADGSSLPDQLTISDGAARMHFAGSIIQGQVTADGQIRMVTGSGSLFSLRADRQGTIEGDFQTRNCTHHLVWKKK